MDARFSGSIPIREGSSDGSLELLQRVLVVVVDAAVGESLLGVLATQGWNITVVELLLFFLEVFVESVRPLTYSSDVEPHIICNGGC